jgi:hypothetical protein
MRIGEARTNRSWGSILLAPQRWWPARDSFSVGVRQPSLQPDYMP